MIPLNFAHVVPAPGSDYLGQGHGFKPANCGDERGGGEQMPQDEARSGMLAKHLRFMAHHII